VKKVQAGYKAEPLSVFLGQPAPTAAPAIDFIKPLTPDGRLSGQVTDPVASVGLSATKYVAKVASACRKPDGLI
jgi:hypothetical protein